MDSKDDADVALMHRLAEGDDLALNELMSRWRDRVGAFLLRMTGNHATAMDLTQETFVRLHTSRHSYKPSAAFSTYLFRIATNLARNHARWRQRHPTVSMDDETSPAPEPAQLIDAPDRQMETRERLQIIEAAIATLPPDQREALLLFTDQDMSYAEIAVAARCSLKAVETRIYRARQTLKSTLTNSGL